MFTLFCPLHLPTNCLARPGRATRRHGGTAKPGGGAPSARGMAAPPGRGRAARRPGGQVFALNGLLVSALALLFAVYAREVRRAGRRPQGIIKSECIMT